MEFQVLGPLQVMGDEGPLALGGSKQRALLAHLVLRANHVVPADVLIDELWGEEPPDTARNTLQTYVYRLRKILGQGRLEGRDGGYQLNASSEEIDASVFEEAVRRAKALASSDPHAAAVGLAEALSMWRGPALGDLAEEPSLRGEVARLEELRLSATEHRIAAEIAVGGHSTVVSELESLTARYPLRERMWANLILARYRLGRQAEALATYQRAREVLAEELGVEPSPELQRLHERILRGDEELAASAPAPAGPAVRPSRMDLPPGTEFAGYRIVSTLGRGGMSVVYLAEHEWLQRRVALKLLAPQLAEDERFRERFVRESRLAASLDHPNVIPIYEAGASGGDLYIAMRYVEGTDLRALLRKEGALDPARAMSMVRQVAAALDAAHEQGLVHRDVKPGNVLISRTRGSEAGEHVYLSDFGLTKRSTSDSGITGTGQFVGTLDYAAPEQFTGKPADARTDVYSLGCVLFECLTGRPPFASENDAGMMYGHLQEEPPKVTAERPELPAAIDRVVVAAMAKDPAGRQPSAGALAAEASRALGMGEPSSIGAPSRGVRALGVAAAVVVALVAGVAIASLAGDEAPQVLAESSPSPSASPSPVPPSTFLTVDRPFTQEEERLLTSIPQEVAADCLPLDRDEPLRGELASVVCRTEAVEVLYQLFPTRDQMDAAFQINANVMGAPEAECATEHLGASSYTVGGDPAGRVLCYQIETLSEEDNGSHIEWTDENTSIYAHAVRYDLGDLSLYDWWLTSSGPVAPGASAGVEKDRPPGTGGARLDDGTYLFHPPEGCVGLKYVTCSLVVDDGRYRFVLSDDGENLEEGALLLRKPNTVVFDPDAGYCLNETDFDARDPRATVSVYEVASAGEVVTFRRTGGGTCAGPRKLGGPWTRPPAGEIAISAEGAIEIVDPGGALVRSTPQSTAPNVWPEWSPDGKRIVFSGGGQDGFDLFVMADDGSDVVLLSGGPDDEITPAWSPDGNRIAFVSGEEVDFDGVWRSRLTLIAPDGSAPQEILVRQNESILGPEWSPDGSQIAFTIVTGSVPTAYVIDADGGNLRRLREDPAFVVGWASVGILFAEGSSILSVAPDGSGERIFLADLPPDILRPALDLSPDGEWIVVSNSSIDQGIASSTLFLIRSDGTDVFQIGFGTDPDWRPRAG